MITRARILGSLVFALLGASAAQAGEDDFTIQLSSRTFFTGAELPRIGPDPEFIPLNRIDWLDELMRREPILKNTVVHIKQLNRTSDFLWSPTGPGGAYKFPDPVPDHLRLPGFRVNSAAKNGFRLLYLTPKSSSKQYAIGCSAESHSATFEYCGLTARYPLDPRVIVLTRIYQPPPVEQLEAFFERIAEISVGIALCLDVTEEPKSDVAGDVDGYLMDHGEGVERRCAPEVTS